MKKYNKFCKLYGIEIEYEKGLTDAEVRLHHVYLRIVDWDKNHKETFGSAKLTVRQLQEYYLPDWSIGKISYTCQGLIKKGWIKKLPDSRIKIRYYEMYRLKNVQEAEHYIQQVRQVVQNTEQTVQDAELSEEEKRAKYNQMKQDSLGKSPFSVQ